ncbi:RdgB/HAM1 family non-canonical purine NTP pyrophosphatase [Balneolaceae bacterium YR4-1]|uniref:dITP/XTP pyrophosphatase n=1 Tax=Halalkalibaculum roseum TaxID=2709311 RepID=A0A6M1SQQ9_9BACT|nr:RdgB/HAM1 family non-canonical purine NTP pyrophosphatase [Halalkalibaculum roseum]NGP77429.1 RdgB/HAM1 family non-canonical purine NTP pyrophosphatase [Halalkalibaculum roseum]
MDTIVLASRNKHKIEELKETLRPLGIKLRSALEFSHLEEVEEDKLTLEGNALKKARYVYEETGLPALADDTGLEVDALDGRPGVFSARYAGENASYEDNVEKLLAELAGVDLKDRRAQFRTVAALVSDEGTHTFEGVCRGKILKEERGEKGFGYDPVFQPEDYEETFAEMASEIKNEISHRGKAIQQLLNWLNEHR